MPEVPRQLPQEVSGKITGINTPAYHDKVLSVRQKEQPAYGRPGAVNTTPLPVQQGRLPPLPSTAKTLSNAPRRPSSSSGRGGGGGHKQRTRKHKRPAITFRRHNTRRISFKPISEIHTRKNKMSKRTH